MSDVRLSWDLVAPTDRQRPVDYVRVDFRVSDTLPWTEQDRIEPTATQELLFQDVAPGEYFYQVVVVDDAGVESIPAGTSVSLDFDDPSPVINLVAAFE